jgi:hypothetical protein
MKKDFINNQFGGKSYYLEYGSVLKIKRFTEVSMNPLNTGAMSILIAEKKLFQSEARSLPISIPLQRASIRLMKRNT